MSQEALAQEIYSEPREPGFATFVTTPNYLREHVETLFVSRNPVASTLEQADTRNSESGEAAQGCLAADQQKKLFSKLQERLETFNPLKAKGITFDAVKKILLDDPNLAFKIFMAEEKLGSEMYLVATGESKADAVFDDLAPEVNVEKEVAFLRSISPTERTEIINKLRSQYPNIPAGAFDRSGEDASGPNKWEGLLIEKLMGLESIPEKDYRALQEKLPRRKSLDNRGISWLEATQGQLARGCAPGGCRSGGGVVVCGDCAGDRCGIRGVRVRAKGSVD